MVYLPKDAETYGTLFPFCIHGYFPALNPKPCTRLFASRSRTKERVCQEVEGGLCQSLGSGFARGFRVEGLGLRV